MASPDGLPRRASFAISESDELLSTPTTAGGLRRRSLFGGSWSVITSEDDLTFSLTLSASQHHNLHCELYRLPAIDRTQQSDEAVAAGPRGVCAVPSIGPEATAGHEAVGVARSLIFWISTAGAALLVAARPRASLGVRACCRPTDSATPSFFTASGLLFEFHWAPRLPSPLGQPTSLRTLDLLLSAARSNLAEAAQRYEAVVAEQKELAHRRSMRWRPQPRHWEPKPAATSPPIPSPRSTSRRRRCRRPCRRSPPRPPRWLLLSRRWATQLDGGRLRRRRPTSITLWRSGPPCSA